MTPRRQEVTIKDLKIGWTPTSKSELSMIVVTRGSQYAEVLDSFLKSGAEVWKREGLTASHVAGLQSQRSKDTYKGKVSLRTHQDSPTKKGEPYKGTYTVYLVRGKAEA